MSEVSLHIFAQKSKMNNNNNKPVKPKNDATARCLYQNVLSDPNKHAMPKQQPYIHMAEHWSYIMCVYESIYYRYMHCRECMATEKDNHTRKKKRNTLWPPPNVNVCAVGSTLG